MNLNDLQAMVDSTTDCLKELFPIVPQVIITDTMRGHALWKSKRISIPAWAFKYGDTYVMYYTLHELTHYVNGKLSGHGELFKKMEDKILLMWNITIERAKAYPKRIYFNGQPKPCPKNKTLLTTAVKSI
jgi:hypothetical protein